MLLLLISQLCYKGQDKNSFYKLNYKTSSDSVLFDTSFTKEKQFFFLGEYHGYKQANRLAYKVFENLVKNNGVNTLILELGKSNEFIIYNYLFRGKLEFKYKYYTYSIADDMAEDFIPLYNLYKCNNNQYDLIVRSIDMEKDPLYAMRCLWLILDENKTTLSAELINARIEIEDSIGLNTKNKNIISFCNRIVKQFKNDSNGYIKSLKNNYTYYRNIIFGLEAKIKYDNLVKQKGADSASRYREIYLFNNLENLNIQNPGRKYFGQFGMVHVINYKDYFLGRRNWYSLAERLIRSNRKVVRMGGYYIKKRRLRSFQYSNLYSKEKFKELKKSFKSKFNFYKTNPSDLNPHFDYLIFCK